MTTKPRSPNWSSTTKIFVTAFTLVLIGITAWRFQDLITTLIVAAMIAYILNPVIIWLADHTPLSRGAAIAVVYPLFALIVIGSLIAVSVTLVQQTLGLVEIAQELIYMSPALIQEFLSEPIVIGNQVIQPDQFNVDLNQLVQQLVTTVRPILSQSAQLVGVAASTTLGWLGWAILIFVLSIYFAIDLPRFGGLIGDAIYQPDYRRDVEHLLRDTKRIWNGYLRGQTTLAVLMVVIYTIMLNLLGVTYSLPLGILAGVLDFFPYVGPFIIVTLSTIVAIFQGDNWLGLTPLWFGFVVLSAGLIVQQIEGNWLNPRIVGGATGLHPLLVIIGAIMGGTLAGLLGVMLAAPTLATLKLIGTYAWRKLFDLDPFPDPEEKQKSLWPRRVNAAPPAAEGARDQPTEQTTSL